MLAMLLARNVCFCFILNALVLNLRSIELAPIARLLHTADVDGPSVYQDIPELSNLTSQCGLKFLHLNVCPLKCRNYARYDKETFNEDLQSASWVSVLSSSDVNLAWSSFKNIFLQICDRHVPLLTKKVRGRQNPWMTSAISNLMSTRDYYLRKAKRSRRDKDWSLYRSYRNQVTAAVRSAKSDYNRNLKKMFLDKSSNLDSINQLKCDGQANQFCKYFSEIKLRISDRFKKSSVAWPICSKSLLIRFTWHQ